MPKSWEKRPKTLKNDYFDYISYNIYTYTIYTIYNNDEKTFTPLRLLAILLLVADGVMPLGERAMPWGCHGSCGGELASSPEGLNEYGRRGYEMATISGITNHSADVNNLVGRNIAGNIPLLASTTNTPQ